MYVTLGLALNLSLATSSIFSDRSIKVTFASGNFSKMKEDNKPVPAPMSNISGLLVLVSAMEIAIE